MSFASSWKFIGSITWKFCVLLLSWDFLSYSFIVSICLILSLSTHIFLFLLQLFNIMISYVLVSINIGFLIGEETPLLICVFILTYLWFCFWICIIFFPITEGTISDEGLRKTLKLEETSGRGVPLIVLCCFVLLYNKSISYQHKLKDLTHLNKVLLLKCL